MKRQYLSKNDKHMPRPFFHYGISLAPTQQGTKKSSPTRCDRIPSLAARRPRRARPSSAACPSKDCRRARPRLLLLLLLQPSPPQRRFQPLPPPPPPPGGPALACARGRGSGPARPPFSNFGWFCVKSTEEFRIYFLPGATDHPRGLSSARRKGDEEECGIGARY